MIEFWHSSCAHKFDYAHKFSTNHSAWTTRQVPPAPAGVQAHARGNGSSVWHLGVALGARAWCQCELGGGTWRKLNEAGQLVANTSTHASELVPVTVATSVQVPETDKATGAITLEIGCLRLHAYFCGRLSPACFVVKPNIRPGPLKICICICRSSSCEVRHLNKPPF